MRQFRSLEESLHCLIVLSVIVVIVFFIEVAVSYRDLKKGRDKKEDHTWLAYWLARKMYRKTQ